MVQDFTAYALATWPDKFSSVDDVRIPKNEVQNKKGQWRSWKRARPWLDDGKNWASAEVRQLWMRFVREKNCDKNRREHTEARATREQIKLVARHYAQSDGVYRRVYDAVATHFAEGLREDLDSVSGGLPSDKYSGLMAKWAPTPGGMHDKATAIVEGIVTCLYPAETHMIEGGLYEDYLSFMTAKYRTELSRLRKHCEVPEHFVGKQAWLDVNYKRMASRCRLLFGKSVFRKHDRTRYDEYVQAAAEAKARARTAGTTAKGTAKVSAGALLPHEIVRRALHVHHSMAALAASSSWHELGKVGGEAAQEREQRACEAEQLQSEKLEVNTQWAELVDQVREGGSIGSCLAVCDVSGSMSGEPMAVAVALSLLLTEIAEEPWRGLVCTFHSYPELRHVNNLPTVKTKAAPPSAIAAAPEDMDASAVLGDVAERARFVQGMSWGFSTDFELVFERLLETALANKLAADQMVKTIFVFSDMEFDMAARGSQDWETAHESIERKFEAAGYPMPEMVYWNLRGDARSIPVTKEKRGTVLLGGFSGGLLKAFLANDLEQYTPMNYLIQTVLEHPSWTHLTADASERQSLPEPSAMLNADRDVAWP